MRALGIIIFLAALSAGLSAQEKYQLDKAHSSITFEASHVVVMPEVSDDEEDAFITVGTTNGSFKDFDIEFDPGSADFEKAKLKVTIQAASLTTENEARDAHLKSKDFLDTPTYSTIVFSSTNFTMVAPELLKVTGDLTMKGVTKTVSFDIRVLGISKDNNKNSYMSFEGETDLDRLEFGLRWNDLLENGAFRISNYIKVKVQANLVEDRAS
ncbi:MAG: polyisoprenoid-binding protein [Calditrichaeota bacterium]|nr:polyisoprenoid-binding protein [Calditrichota bacterium]HQU72877.1 YceI family protein [Calditrichia bacterium]